MAITLRERKAENCSQRGLQAITKKQYMVVVKIWSLELNNLSRKPASQSAKLYSSVPQVCNKGKYY